MARATNSGSSLWRNLCHCPELTITNRGKGRFTLHQIIGGIERYLTAEANGGTHVFTLPKNAGFNRQIWRADQGFTTNLISQGKSGRFLQADVTA